MLRHGDSGVERVDYCRDAWQEPGEGESLSWWRSRMPDDTDTGPKPAPVEVLLQLFDEWADEPDRTEARYVLALLLIRRKVFRLAERGVLSVDEVDNEADDSAMLSVDCPQRAASYELPIATPNAEHAAAIQAELNTLLYGGGSESKSEPKSESNEAA